MWGYLPFNKSCRRVKVFVVLSQRNQTESSERTLKLFGFPIYWLWTHLMKVITEKRRAHQIKFLRWLFMCFLFVCLLVFFFIFPSFSLLCFVSVTFIGLHGCKLNKVEFMLTYELLDIHYHYWTWLWVIRFWFLAVSFISGGNRSTRRKQPPCRKSLTNFIT